MPVANWPGVKSSDALGRVYTVYVTNFECFCLRILLHRVRGPTSFKDLKIVNSLAHRTYLEACEAQGLLENDNHWNETMEEAAQCRSPDKITEIYATLISSCGHCNPRILWDKYKKDMVEDILWQMQRVHAHMTFNEPIYNEALIIIENKVLTRVGKKLQDFGMLSRSDGNYFNDEIARELDYNFTALQQQVAELVPELLSEQSHVFLQVLRKTEFRNGALFFFDAPGGTGKKLLLNLLLMSIRKDQKIAVAVTSSGIAATLLNGCCTANSVLKIAV
ncbi:hypothetical protein X975_04048, partial [Stegodyphus mimosarum]